MKILLHPVFVHFPIAFYLLEAALLILWEKTRDDAYRRFALFSFRWGYWLMWATLLTGFVDGRIWRGISGAMAWHFYAATLVVTVYTARAFCWKTARRQSRFHLAGALLGNILVACAAYYGGRLVYQ